MHHDFSCWYVRLLVCLVVGMVGCFQILATKICVCSVIMRRIVLEADVVNETVVDTIAAYFKILVNGKRVLGNILTQINTGKGSAVKKRLWSKERKF